DTAMMAQILKESGYEIVDFEDEADVYIINSCTVTGTGDKRSRQMVHRAKREHPNAVICMAGCMVQTDTDAALNLGVDLAIGTSGRNDLPKLIERAKKERVVSVCDNNVYEDCFKTLQSERTRGFLKIQDGCDKFCTYCIIPAARGKSRSRALSSVVAEAEALVNDGYKEIVLTGIHIASYGKDIDLSFLDAIKAVSSIKGVERLRLGSLEPTILTKEFCKQLAEIDNLCPCFHVSVQSGCDKTLKAMGRRYNTKGLKEYIANLRTSFNGCAVTTDIIVGFPTETDEDFKECMEFVKEIGFARCHIFPYSMRKNTPAAKMKNQVEKAEKHQRAKEMIALCKALEGDYIAENIGQNRRVLFETEVEKGLFCGYTENYIKAYAKGEELFGKIKPVLCESTFKDGVMAKIID
ncbi:MAG: tRNA (N(6)-L-threonylcarbamoyladenosine(37)-C(2))-methylthiotransferase MtaB, partial [Clostridia bacterium]|nr:tRNA (N(6)-L-threonylcarbamoyladenosine(37)-C(2))-methylthiotransferase MtaB [Clostridia bacterium]